jgi:mevalonate kinase
MKLKRSLFYAKILLFGEYGIIEDSMGLSIPFNKFNGALKTDGRKDAFSETSNQDIREFYQYLTELRDKHELQCRIDFETLWKDIQGGLYFDSSIPQGFGVGSSGALVASIYDKYCTDKIILEQHQKGDEILALKQIFSKLESFFPWKEFRARPAYLLPESSGAH